MAQKILLVNKFYYSRGGDCVCTLNLERLLRDNGYEVAVFAMQYPDNVESQYSGYFASQVDFSGGVGAKIAAAKRIFGWGDVRGAFARLLDDFKPDVVHLQNIHSYISPVVAEMAKKRGCRVVWTLHDYKLLCPSYSCLRDGQPCELCFADKLNVLKLRCMKGSMAASALAYLEAMRWNRPKLERMTDAFVCPSGFMAGKMAQGGFDRAKLQVICNFIDPEKLDCFKQMPCSPRDGSYYVYVGRLSREKGVETLIAAAAELPYRLKVAGDGPLLDALRQRYQGSQNIEFLGRQDAGQVSGLLGGAQCSVMPSECYENNPLSVIESLCAGTPVVGAEIGGIPELIEPENGVKFRSGDKMALQEAVKTAFEREWNNKSIKNVALDRFSPKKYLNIIAKVYK